MNSDELDFYLEGAARAELHRIPQGKDHRPKWELYLLKTRGGEIAHFGPLDPRLIYRSTLAEAAVYFGKRLSDRYKVSDARDIASGAMVEWDLSPVEWDLSPKAD